MQKHNEWSTGKSLILHFYKHHFFLASTATNYTKYEPRCREITVEHSRRRVCAWPRPVHPGFSMVLSCCLGFFTASVFHFTFLCNTTPSLFPSVPLSFPTFLFPRSCKTVQTKQKRNTFASMFQVGRRLAPRQGDSLTAKMTDKFLWLSPKVKPKSNQQPGSALATPLCLEMRAIIS